MGEIQPPAHKQATHYEDYLPKCNYQVSPRGFSRNKNFQSHESQGFFLHPYRWFNVGFKPTHTDPADLFLSMNMDASVAIYQKPYLLMIFLLGGDLCGHILLRLFTRLQFYLLFVIELLGFHLVLGLQCTNNPLVLPAHLVGQAAHHAEGMTCHFCLL